MSGWSIEAQQELDADRMKLHQLFADAVVQAAKAAGVTLGQTCECNACAAIQPVSLSQERDSALRLTTFSVHVVVTNKEFYAFRRRMKAKVAP